MNSVKYVISIGRYFVILIIIVRACRCIWASVGGRGGGGEGGGEKNWWIVGLFVSVDLWELQ